MNTSIILSFHIFAVFMKCVNNQELCDERFKNNLITGVMNYYGTHFLVFREQYVWSIELDISSYKFLKPKLKEDFVGVIFEDYKWNHTLISGFVFTKRPKCTIETQIKCEKMLNTSVFFYNDRSNSGHQIYRVFRLGSDGQFEKWLHSDYDLPYSWRERGYQDTDMFDFAKILGAAFMPNTMELYMISWDRVFILYFNDSSRYDYPLDTREPKLYTGTTGGFEFKNLPHFIINNTIFGYSRSQKKIYFLNSSWDFFCHDSIVTKITTEKPFVSSPSVSFYSTSISVATSVSTETMKTLEIATKTDSDLKTDTRVETKDTTAGFYSPTEEPKTSVTSSTTSDTRKSMKSESLNLLETNILIMIVVGTIAIIAVTGCILTSFICCVSHTNKGLSPEEQRLLRAKQFIQQKKLEKKKLIIKN